MLSVFQPLREAMRSGRQSRVFVVLYLFCLCIPSVDLSATEVGYDELIALRQARHQARQISRRSGLAASAAQVGLTARSSAELDWPIVVDDTLSRMAQKNPLCLPGNGDGGLVFFLDERNGPTGLWGVPVDTGGSPTSSNTLVYAGAGLGGLGIPAGAGTGNGSSLVAFPEVDSGGIFVLSIADDLATPAEVRRVSPVVTPGNMPFDRPDIAVTSTGAVVVWEDYRSGSHVYARLTDPWGIPTAPEFIINESPTAASRWVPRVAASDSDTLLFVWEDYRADKADIYYRIFTGDGTAVTGDLLATTDGAAAPQYQPDVTYGKGFGFLLTWIDARAGSPAVYARLVNPDGSADNPEFVLAHPGDTADFWEPSLAGGGSDQAVVVYESIAERTIISGQRLYLGSPLGDAFSISDPTAYRDRFSPAVAYRADGGMLVSWMDRRTDNFDVRARSLDTSATPAGDDLKLNDDIAGNQQWLGDGVHANSTTVIVVYTDQNRDDGDIYVQQITSSGQTAGDPILINDDMAPARQAEPTVDITADGTLLIAWTDRRSDQVSEQRDIYFQALLPGMIPSGPNLRLSDDTNLAAQTQPDIAAFPAGGAIAVWTDYRLADTAAVYGQIIDESFGLEGGNFQVDAGFPHPDDIGPNVATFDTEDAAIGWRSNESGLGAIWIVRYNRTLGLINDPFELDIDSTDYLPAEFDLAARPGAGFIVFWRGEAVDRSAVYFQRFDNSFLPVGANVKVSASGSPLPGQVSVDVDSAGYMVFAWTENIGGKPAVVRRIFDPSIAPVGPVEVISNDAGHSISYGPVALATGEYATVLYNDNRIPGRGFDVRANFYLYSTTGVFEEDELNLPDRPVLMQNFPNPFNPSTVINFITPTAGEYELVVYDILGRQVRVLWDGYHPGGPGSVVWNGTNTEGKAAPSGIYLYCLRGASFESTRKMILVK